MEYRFQGHSDPSCQGKWGQPPNHSGTPGLEFQKIKIFYQDLSFFTTGFNVNLHEKGSQHRLRTFAPLTAKAPEKIRRLSTCIDTVHGRVALTAYAGFGGLETVQAANFPS